MPGCARAVRLFLIPSEGMRTRVGVRPSSFASCRRSGASPISRRGPSTGASPELRPPRYVSPSLTSNAPRLSALAARGGFHFRFG